MRGIIFYTDAITALVRAAAPLLDYIEDAGRRGDVGLKRYLLLTYNPLVNKIKSCAAEAGRDEKWTSNELSEGDAALLARVAAEREVVETDGAA